MVVSIRNPSGLTEENHLSSFSNMSFSDVFVGWNSVSSLGSLPRTLSGGSQNSNRTSTQVGLSITELIESPPTGEVPSDVSLESCGTDTSPVVIKNDSDFDAWMEGSISSNAAQIQVEQVSIDPQVWRAKLPNSNEDLKVLGVIDKVEDDLVFEDPITLEPIVIPRLEVNGLKSSVIVVPLVDGQYRAMLDGSLGILQSPDVQGSSSVNDQSIPSIQDLDFDKPFYRLYKLTSDTLTVVMTSLNSIKDK